ncbi:DUF3549 family protein [Gallaecimonas mangrovi]|uniref:DUF3549 family protein n=1 Tax=Gallaecimonas mangrovi TaxID=2291597 RepID=UPI001868E3E3|nr:DUF3549 family protein [Gallaecimonas mangrovi]
MELSNLADFLAASGARYQIFDMGRRVRPLPQADFERCAKGECPYPYPLQRQAWLGILFWQQQPYVWFVRLGLDEQGLLNQGDAAQFMAQVLTAMQQGKDTLPDNPYTFVPNEEKRAAFHSQSRLYLGEPASIYYEDAAAFANGQRADWQAIGLQGLADLVARDKNTTWFAAFITQAPLPVLEALAIQLENYVIEPALADALWQRFNDSPLLIGRALGGSHLRDDAADRLLEKADIQALMVVAGRLWESLETPSRLDCFLEKAAQLEGGRHFPPLFADLVMLPSLRPELLAKLRDPERSDALTKAIGRLF